MKRTVLTHLLTPLLALGLTMASPATGEESYTLPIGATVGPLDSFKECSVCPEMVVMPLGEFIMGADLEESRRLAELQEKLSSQLRPYGLDEGPRHQVLMDIPFAIGRSEITRGEWMACVSARACSHTPTATVRNRAGSVLIDEPTAPVIDVSYQDAQAAVIPPKFSGVCQ